MKKNILIICTTLIIFSLTACAQKQNNTPTIQTETASAKTVAFENTFTNAVDRQINPDLIYKVESRFMTRVTKDKLDNATSIIDILPKRATMYMEQYQNVVVSILQADGEITAIGIDETLNEAQLKLLKSADYSTNFYITSDCKHRTEFGKIENYNLVYYMTVIPEKEAEFTYGQEALIEYLKTNSKSKTAVIRADKLQPCRINFKVTKEGKIKNVKLDSTSGYPSVDEALIDLLTNMPQTWIPATNTKGEKIDQELVFFFGSEGC
jgi:hypothetical protein